MYKGRSDIKSCTFLIVLTPYLVSKTPLVLCVWIRRCMTSISICSIFSLGPWPPKQCATWAASTIHLISTLYFIRSGLNLPVGLILPWGLWVFLCSRRHDFSLVVSKFYATIETPDSLFVAVHDLLSNDSRDRQVLHHKGRYSLQGSLEPSRK